MMFTPRTLLRVLVGCVVCAVPMHGAFAEVQLDSNGYFRVGPGATSKNANRACYQLAGTDFKYRLGNECNFYGEFLFSATISKPDAPEVMKVHFMPSISKTGASNPGDSRFEAAQVWAEMTGLDFAPQASFWAGKRFHRTSYATIVDHFMEKLDGTGTGAVIPAMGGNLEVAAYRSDSLTKDVNGNDNPGSRLNVWLRDVPANPDGHFSVLTTLTKGDFTGGHKGYGLSGCHRQGDKTVRDENNACLQFAQGSTAINGNFGTLTDGSDVKKWRLMDSYYFQVTSKLEGQAVASYQQRKSNAGDTTITSLGGRLSYAFTRNFKLLTEVGLDQVKPQGGDSAHLTKITIAPTLAAGPSFWSRPELRFYVTHATWNDAANAAAGAGGLTGLANGKTSGTSFGAQIEAAW